MRWHPNPIYDIINRKYFGNKLPKYRVIFANMTSTWGCVEHGKRLLSIATELRENKTTPTLGILTLFHEMAHIEDYLAGGRRVNLHGYRFNRIMKRLAATGAFNGLW